MSAAIFNGTAVKILKDILRSKTNGQILFSTVNPMSSAVDANAGDLLISTNKFVYIKQDSGSSTNWNVLMDDVAVQKLLKNRLRDGSFNIDASLVSTFDDGASSTPVDLTGGSPSVVTAAQNTTTPLNGAGDLKISHSAADGQGEGVSFAVTMENSDKASVMQFTFDYKTSSGYVDDDLQIWVYDVTNAVLIQPAEGFKLKANTVNGKHRMAFQTASDSTSYRIGFFCPNTSTTSWDVYVDNFEVKPAEYNAGMPASDWVSWTPTGSWVSNVTYTGKRRRIGEDEEFEVYVLCSGAPTATGLTINLPVTIDTSKLAHTTFGDGSSAVGFGKVLDSGANSFNVVVSPQTSTSVIVKISNAAGTYVTDANVTDTVPITFGASDSVHLRFRVPALGYSSSVLMSDQADQRSVVAIYNASGSTAITTTTPKDYNTKIVDTHGAVTTGASWKFTAPVSGDYEITATLQLSSSAGAFAVYKNGTLAKYLFRSVSAASQISNGTVVLPLNAGDYVDIRTDASTHTTDTSANGNAIYIRKVQGPSAIGATETIAARYSTDAGQAINNNSLTIIDFEDKDFDTHNAVTTGVNWRFTAPAAGIYQVSCQWTFVESTYAGTSWFIMGLYKNGSGTLISHLGNHRTENGSSSSAPSGSGTSLVKLNAGDYIDLRMLQDNGLTENLRAAGYNNNVCIMRVGI